MNSKNGPLIFCLIELLFFTIFAVRLTVTSIIERRKRKHPLVPQTGFWFYIFFILSSISYSIISILMIECYFKINSNILDYFKNLLYTSSFVYLQIYCYKIVTIPDGKNFYKGNVLKNSKKNDELEKWIYTSSILITVTQTLAIGLSPIFLSVSLLKVEVISWIAILFSVITLIKIFRFAKSGKLIVKRWLIYASFSLFIVPLSFCVNLFSQFVDLLTYGVFWGLLLRGIFMAFRICQLFIIAWCSLSNSDMRLLYD